MNAESTIQYNSLSWVKEQLDVVLVDAQQSLSDYIENNEDTASLQQCVDHLRLVCGTLQMVEIFGAAMLAEEMQKTAQAQLDGSAADKSEDVFDVLMRSMLQLPDYLEGLQGGNTDSSIVLLPLMNDLRAARKESLLSEIVLFLPELESVEIEGVEVSEDVEVGRLQNEARRLRTHYQLGLLDLIKNNKEQAGVQRILAVVQSLVKASRILSVKNFWYTSAALIEIALEQKNDIGLSEKKIISAVDRQLKELIDTDEESFSNNIPEELYKNILYYIGRSRSESDRINKVKQAYKLDELLPDESSADAGSSGMGGLNNELFATVSDGIKEDLTKVKDVIEIFIHSEEQDINSLEPLVEQLRKIGDTYGMLGLGETRSKTLEQSAVIASVVKGETEVSEDLVMKIADELLSTESELNDYIAQRSGLVDSNLISGEDNVVPAAEYRDVLSTVIKEGLLNFTFAKESILSFISGIGSKQQLDDVIQRLEEVRGITLMLSMPRLEAQVTELKSYVQLALIDNNHMPDDEEQEAVADVVTCIEYFLESMVEGRLGVEAGLVAGDAAAQFLSDASAQYQGKAESEDTDSTDALEIVEDAVTETAVSVEEAVKESVEVVTAAEDKRVVVDTGESGHEEFIILAEDADEEILEIFIEEAVEVLGAMNESYLQWKSDNDDEESLAIIRRSFHTLKGSGRLIGALLIGEFAWKFENMLNHLIEDQISVSNDLFVCMDEALAVIPQLIEQLRGNREPISNIHSLMHSADVISEGGAPEVPVAPEDVEEPEVTEDVSDAEMTDESVEGSGLVDMEKESEIAPTDEDFVVNLSDMENAEPDEDLVDLGDVLVHDEESTDDEFKVIITEDEEEDEPLTSMDPVLFGIYYEESTGRLKYVEERLREHDDGIQRLTADKDLMRAFHTLYGSARTAEIQEIAELCGATEKYLKARQEAEDTIIPEDIVTIIKDVISTTTSMIEGIKSGKPQQSDAKLLGRVNVALQGELQSQLQQSIETPRSESPTQIDEAETDVVEIEASVESVPEVKTESERDADTQAVLPSYGDIDEDLIDIFIEEAEELLESCDVQIISLKENAGNKDAILVLLRDMHTLKGGARMADLKPFGDLTHVLESLVVELEKNNIQADKEIFDLLHESMDSLNNMLSSVRNRGEISFSNFLVTRIEALTRGETVEQQSTEPAEIEADSLDEVIVISDEALESIERSVTDNESEKQDKKEKVTPHWGQRATDSNYKESQDQVRVKADLLNSLVNSAGEVNIFHARMGKQITDIGFNLLELEQTVVRLKEQLRSLEIETEIQILSSYEKESDRYGQDFDPLEMDRYSTMQQLSRSLAETASDVQSIKDIINDIVRDSETLLVQESRVSTELQEGLMRTRMVRFGGLSSRMRRIVRQTARELNKEVELEIFGDTIEVDRKVLDSIVAPLEHMLRNAVAHGIEEPQQRVSDGKNEVGKIIIVIDRTGSEIIIKVSDDGAGMNIDAIREKAIKKGLLDKDNNLDDQKVLQFILEPGFSTADTVTQIAGRGVGMDVVDTEIKQLGGLLEIETTAGKGTEFIITLPVTLAINQALLVASNEDMYAIPLASIEGVVRITGHELQSFYDSDEKFYEFNGIEYELKHMGNLMTGKQGDYSKQYQLFPVLLAKVGEHYFALHVDDLVERREIVVKPVGHQLGMVRGISGATILADGRVVLIIEMAALVVGETLFKTITEVPVIDQVKDEDRETVVMIVDDSITIRKVTSRMLERNGISVVMAKDGVDATNQLQETIPDLMLLDIEMPRMDGFELATYMRNDDRLKDIPIIMITSRTGEKHKEKAFAIGVNDFLGKPYQEEELMSNINGVLSA